MSRGDLEQKRVDRERGDLEQVIHTSTGKRRIRWIKQWIETLTTHDHHHCFSEPMFAHDESTSLCDLCARPNDELIQNCYHCDRRLGKSCGCAEGSDADRKPGDLVTCSVCTHVENFFVMCSCGVDECYNYWGINPKLESYYRCKRHNEPLADRCVPRVKCATCRNKVAIPYCAKCPFPIPDVVRCKTCVKWS